VARSRSAVAAPWSQTAAPMSRSRSAPAATYARVTVVSGGPVAGGSIMPRAVVAALAREAGVARSALRSTTSLWCECSPITETTTAMFRRQGGFGFGSGSWAQLSGTLGGAHWPLCGLATIFCGGRRNLRRCNHTFPTLRRTSWTPICSAMKTTPATTIGITLDDPDMNFW
jgi:hypothetical protein